MSKKITVHGFEGEWRIVADLIRGGNTVLLLEYNEKLMFAKTVNEDVERISGPFTIGEISDMAFNTAFGLLAHRNVTPTMSMLAMGFFYAFAPRLTTTTTTTTKTKEPIKH